MFAKLMMSFIPRPDREEKYPPTLPGYEAKKIIFCDDFCSCSSALRVSRSAKPTALDGGPKRQTPVAFIGKKGKDFEFSDLPFRVSFVPCSARGRGEEDESVAEIEEVTTWIDQLC